MDQNSIHEEMKSRLKSGNDCCHSVQNLLSSTLRPKNVNIKIYRTIIFQVFRMYVKLRRCHWGRNVGWGLSRMGCWGGYCQKIRWHHISWKAIQWEPNFSIRKDRHEANGRLLQFCKSAYKWFKVTSLCKIPGEEHFPLVHPWQETLEYKDCLHRAPHPLVFAHEKRTGKGFARDGALRLQRGVRISQILLAVRQDGRQHMRSIPEHFHRGQNTFIGVKGHAECSQDLANFT